MIKAVFFDWSNTVARYLPRREDLQSQALREFGFNVSPQGISPAIAAADKYLIEEAAGGSLRLRDPSELAQIYTHYEQIVFNQAGVAMPPTSRDFPKFIKRLNELYSELRFVLYDDVLPCLKTLKERQLILALVTNVDADLTAVCRELGLAAYLDFLVTSVEVGVSKPHPKIFLAALEMAGVRASEAVHVGDQYDIDVAGARSAGIKPILLDRLDSYGDVIDCVRIHNLSELARNV